jgi:peptide deformylase
VAAPGARLQGDPPLYPDYDLWRDFPYEYEFGKLPSTSSTAARLLREWVDDVPKRILVIDLQDPEEEGGEPVRTPMVFINPEILTSAETIVPYQEGCLSVPDQYAEVERPDAIRARWLDRDGKVHEEELDGLLATCLQHEMDHLEGILFIDHLSRLKRDMILRKLAKARKERALAA